MSISSEITRISGNVADALDAIADKGVTVPSGANSDDLATLIAQISGGGTAAISVVDTTDTAGGTVRTITALDISDTTAVASDVAQGKYFYTAQGQKTAGTGSGGSPSQTQHTIYFEFSDNTNTTITAYWDGTFISDAITATTPTTYGGKTVTLAQLDGVTWYEPANIPLNTQLIDYTAVKGGYIVNDDGTEEVSQWACVSDYTLIDPTMTFSYIGYCWYDLVFFDAIYMYGDADEIVSDYAHGTLTPAKIPASAVYVRINSTPTNPSSSQLSLIRTA